MAWNILYVLLALPVFPYLLLKAIVVSRWRKGLREKCAGARFPRRPPGDVVWFHCVSVGETLAAVRLVEAVRERFPSCAVAVSTTTVTGRKVAEERMPADFFFYYPFDFSWSVAAVLDRLRPAVLVLLELEVWPNMMRGLKRRGIPAAVVNGRLSARSHRRLVRLRPLVRGTFAVPEFYAVQDETYRRRFLDLGVPPERVFVTGSMKYDSLAESPDEVSLGRLKALFRVRDDQIVLMGGSTHEGEERILLDAFMRLRRRWHNLRLVLVPRHPERAARVRSLVESFGLSPCLRSELTAADPAAEDAVVIVDTVGELAALYGLCTVAFVGGSFSGTGGHNMLEPAAFGKAVVVGPSTFNFAEDMRRLRENGGICEAADEDALLRVLEELLADPEKRVRTGEAARSAVRRFRGAVEKNCALIEKYLFRKREE